MAIGTPEPISASGAKRPAGKKPNFHGDWAVPKKWDLPGIREIVTKLVESEAFDGNFVYNTKEDRCGVLLDRRLPVEVQRYTYLHELLHGVHELIDIMLEEYPQHVMTKAMYKKEHPEWREPGEEEKPCPSTPVLVAPTP